jgi:cell division septal protein FtsQ
MASIVLTQGKKKNHAETASAKSGQFGLVLVGVFSIAIFFGIQGFLSSSYFEIKEIRWSGVKQINPKELDQQFQFVLGKNLVHLSIADVHSALINNRWVKEAVVRKVFPSRVDVTLTERVPAAVEIDPLSNRMVLRDSEGVVLEEGEQANLPHMIYYNPNTYTKAMELAPLLAKHKDALIDLSHPKEVSVRLKKGVVNIGSEHFTTRWERFVKIEEDLNKRNVAPWEADLRFPSQVVIKTKTASVEPEE